MVITDLLSTLSRTLSVKDEFGRDRPAALRQSPPPVRSAHRQLADYGSVLMPHGAP